MPVFRRGYTTAGYWVLLVVTGAIGTACIAIVTMILVGNEPPPTIRNHPCYDVEQHRVLPPIYGTDC